MHKCFYHAFVPVFMLIAFTASTAQEVHLQYRFEPGKTYRYKRVISSNVTSTIPGQGEVSYEQKVETPVTLTGISAPEGLVGFQYLQDTAFVESTSSIPSAMDFPSIASLLNHVRIAFTITPRGVIRNARLLDSLPSSGRPMMYAAFTDSALAAWVMPFRTLPDRALKEGLRWSVNQSDTISPQAATKGAAFKSSTMITRETGEYVVKGFEEFKGMKCVRLNWNITQSTESEMETNNMEMFMEVETRYEGSMLFAYEEGILAHLEETQSSTQTTSVSGQQEMVVPASTEQKTTLTFIP
ncbi:MAG: hypothetical protein GXO82_10310 [Chlorobi bacterium]|nr:hypothetical protein [Chlorobiota bacterium]